MNNKFSKTRKQTTTHDFKFHKDRDNVLVGSPKNTQPEKTDLIHSKGSR